MAADIDAIRPDRNPRYRRNERAHVAESSIHGYGLFASRRLRRGDYIGTYRGRGTDRDGTYVLWLYDGDSGQWEGIDGSNEMRYLNHSDQPNADFWNTDLYALRDIEPGEEITFDYYWEPEDG